MLIQEEGRLKKNGVHSTHLMVDNGTSSSKEKPGNKGKKVKNPLHVNEGQIHKKPRCHFCKKTSHFSSCKSGSYPFTDLLVNVVVLHTQA